MFKSGSSYLKIMLNFLKRLSYLYEIIEIINMSIDNGKMTVVDKKDVYIILYTCICIYDYNIKDNTYIHIHIKMNLFLSVCLSVLNGFKTIHPITEKFWKIIRCIPGKDFVKDFSV